MGKEVWNLSKLFCGSEGILVIFLEVKIKLEFLLKYKFVCVVYFVEVFEVIEVVNVMLFFDFLVIEILDDMVVRFSWENFII